MIFIFFKHYFSISIALCCSQHYSYDMRGEEGSLSGSLWGSLIGFCPEGSMKLRRAKSNM